MLIAFGFAAISVPANVHVRWWCGPPGGGGDRHLATVPQEVVGDRLPWGGERQGGGRVGTLMLFGNLPCGTTDSPLAPGLAVQLCLLHPRQYISLCISQNASCFGFLGCSCTAVNRMYSHGSLTCYWPRCACQPMGQFTASAPTNQSPFGR